MKNLLPSSIICDLCSEPSNFEDVNRYIAGRFRCQKRAAGHIILQRNRKKTYREFCQSAALNTFFNCSKIGLQKCILLTYCWAHDFSYRQIRNECHSISETEEERLSQETISDWSNYLREVAVVALDSLYFQQGKIGGQGRVVEIDESKFGKRKYNRGKRVDGSWILGMIDIGTKEDPNKDGPFRLEICPDNKRTKEALLPLIRKYVYPGTIIRTDCWLAYDFTDDDYIHETANHSLHYKDPETGVHTNNIESDWRPLKRALQGTHKKYLADHLCKYLWRREVRKKRGDFFENIIEDIARIDWKKFTENDNDDTEDDTDEDNDSIEEEVVSPKRKYSRQDVIDNQLFS